MGRRDLDRACDHSLKANQSDRSHAVANESLEGRRISILWMFLSRGRRKGDACKNERSFGIPCVDLLDGLGNAFRDRQGAQSGT
jgi:hypothetical protein